MLSVTPSWMFIGAAALLLTTLFEGLSIFHVHNILPNAPSYSYNDNDFPAELPMPIDVDATLRFENNYYKITLDDEWDSMIPPNQGRVRLGPKGREFDVAMYQQLDCLDALRLAYLAVHDRPSLSAPADFPKAESCIDQLRQAILCTADITLDPAQVVFHGDSGSTTSASTGTGVDHRCRDWTRVRAVVEKNQEAAAGLSKYITYQT